MAISDLLDLSGRTVLITGASSGIGSAIARKLSQVGAQVILHCGTNKVGISSLADELRAKHIVQCNLSKPRQIKAMFEDLAVENCMPDMLVNNAGVQTVATVLEADKQVWRDINKVNLEAVYALCKYMANALIARGRSGAIVNIASIEGLDPADGHAHYAASKAALLMYTRASALEMGSHNIRVNAVAPGLISRPGIEDDWPEGVKRWCERAPLGRMGTGEDVANGVLFLLSPAAVWISGHTLVIDGGMGTQNRW
ncbi:MAG: short-chain dehydrogenase [Robiginitomaculum sp.]|nr:MAG: short-chain dehydrogenase [Robiginitomaculum sp.]